MDILTVFCEIDDFCNEFEPRFNQMLIGDGTRQRTKPGAMSLSEVMTILVMFHLSGYRNLKTFYTAFVGQYWRAEFPHLSSYTRFVERQRDVLIPLWCYLHLKRGNCTGISFVDATTLKVCQNLRIPRHKVFAGSAGRGQTSVGWFYGFKLHLIINECGEIVSCYLTAGNVDDRQTVAGMVKKARRMFGKLFGDKGYISKALSECLQTEQAQLVTGIKKNMKNKVVNLYDKLMLRKRAIIETVNDQLKNISQIEHTRHRSLWNFLGNVAAGLIAYSFREKKPSLNLNKITQLEPIAI
jgi:Transposase DDE domain